MSTKHIIVNPSNGNGSHIADALVALASETSVNLESVWDEVGYSADEKRRQMEGLLSGFRALCMDKEKEERGVKDQFLASIKETQGKISIMRKALGKGDDEDARVAGSNLTEKLAHYEMEEEELRKTCDTQKSKFEKLSQEIVHMSQVLADEPESNSNEWRDTEGSLTDTRLQEFVDKRASLNQAMEERMQTVAEVVHGIQVLMGELKMTATTELDNRVLGSLAHPACTGVPVLQTTERTASSVGIGQAALEEVLVRHKELLEERNCRKKKLERMGEEIMDLWQQLDVGKEEQETFSASVDGMGTQTMEAGERELARLRKLKVDMMSGLIQDTRERIQELWNEIGCSAAERAVFGPLQVGEDGFTDDLLIQHKHEIIRLEDRLGTMKHILEKIEEREDLTQKRMEMETSMKDPSRLMPKGGQQERRHQQQRLQLELEMEKKVKKRLPLLTNHLRKAVPQWEHKHGSAFFYKGERYLDVLEQSEEDYASLKEQIKAAKEVRKKEERNKLVMQSPGGQQLSLSLGRDTPRSTRKTATGTGRKIPTSVKTGRVPSTPVHHTGQGGRTQGHFVMSTPDHKADCSSSTTGSDMTSDAATGAIITDVSNHLGVNDQQGGGREGNQAVKKKPSVEGNNNTENNSSFGSVRESFEGFDT